MAPKEIQVKYDPYTNKTQPAVIDGTTQLSSSGHACWRGGTAWSRLLQRLHTLVKPFPQAAPACGLSAIGRIEIEPCQSPYRALRGRVNGLGYPPDEQLMPYLELAGLGSTVLLRTFDLWYDLISAWQLETHTFHLPCGECTVTLVDVALQLGLPIDRSAVTGVSTIVELVALCDSLLGVSPNDVESKFTGLRFPWLKANFEHLSINATE
ncbi:hypothetical protein J1N35_010503 [Gossypium stocksii]|uniref:Aminotransferase-like plant mobile domain-containing protein n=1 Tax=Gossypium stocksii TaxID=47602 RepID=A0A9D3W2L9_9ROSI|nr:hypothetical protein J1N35_010503 [Gossypium stocksii]